MLTPGAHRSILSAKIHDLALAIILIGSGNCNYSCIDADMLMGLASMSFPDSQASIHLLRRLLSRRQRALRDRATHPCIVARHYPAQVYDISTVAGPWRLVLPHSKYHRTSL